MRQNPISRRISGKRLLPRRPIEQGGDRYKEVLKLRRLVELAKGVVGWQEPQCPGSRVKDIVTGDLAHSAT
jgi:hypothetical protein